VDAPPLLSVTDAAILAARVDGVVLVIDPQNTKRRELIRAREAIDAVGGTVIGVVVNRLATHQGVFGAYYGYYQSYASEYTKAEDSPTHAAPVA
jgi:Mrp family chromosome partitioning ATPase